MLNRLLGGLGRTLIFCGVVLLLFVGYQLWGTSLDEEQHQTDLTLSLGHQLGVPAANNEADADASAVDDAITKKLAAIDPQTAPAAEVPPEGDAGGKIDIAKIGLHSKTFVEGVTKADLRKGPGHYPGTPLPGNAGNASIAGHRTTYGAPFNRIDELVPGDKITVYTLQGKFTYEVMASPEDRRSGPKDENWGDGWFAVRPNDVSVIAPTDDNRLTLTACHPKYSAKLRIVVQAKLVAEPAEAPASTTTTTAKPGSADKGQTVGSAPEDLISGDPGERTPAILFGLIVVAIWLVSMGCAALLRRRDRRAWPIYVVTVLASIAPLWFCFVHLDRFLPSY